jgi:acyl carrier protein
MKNDPGFDEKIMALIAAGVPGKFRKVAIARETHLQKELGLDSIGILSLVFRFEESFSIDIAQLGIEVNIAKLKTVGDLLASAQDIMSKAAIAKES